jgi:hypothetical protein
MDRTDDPKEGSMSQYMLLIYTPTEGALSPEEARAEFPKWVAYTEALREASALVADNALQGAETAATLRVREGERIVTDGPFAETKETLAGYYVIDVEDREAALDWAERIPSAPRGSVEVRPVMVFEQADVDAAAGAASA